MKINAIIQARMNSKRLPGKVMKEIRGKPLIGYLMERVAMADVHEMIVVMPEGDLAGSLGSYVEHFPLRRSAGSHPENPFVVTSATHGRWLAFGGPEEDVAERFRGALTKWPCDAFVRVCADSPLLDPKLIDEAIGLSRKEEPDIACNTYPRTYPAGQCVEVVDTAQFLNAVDKMDAHDREHVTPYLYQRRVSNFEYLRNLSNMGMAVDTQQDFDRIKAMIEKLTRPHTGYGWQELSLLL